MQIGQGDLNMDHLFAILSKLDVGFIPEIWNGHLKHGEGMKKALRTIEDLLSNKLAGKSNCCNNSSCNKEVCYEKH